jgi:hypothetical protein
MAFMGVLLHSIAGLIRYKASGLWVLIGFVNYSFYRRMETFLKFKFKTLKCEDKLHWTPFRLRAIRFF